MSFAVSTTKTSCCSSISLKAAVIDITISADNPLKIPAVTLPAFFICTLAAANDFFKVPIPAFVSSPPPAKCAMSLDLLPAVTAIADCCCNTTLCAFIDAVAASIAIFEDIAFAVIAAPVAYAASEVPFKLKPKALKGPEANKAKEAPAK